MVSPFNLCLFMEENWRPITMSSDSSDAFDDDLKWHSGESEFGEIEIDKGSLTENRVTWNIPHFSVLSMYRSINSPAFMLFNARWWFKFDPVSEHSEDHLALELKMDKKSELAKNMLCTFCVKSANDSFVGLASFKHIFCSENRKLIAEHFDTSATSWLRRCDLLKADKLIILCSMKQLPHPTKLTELNLLSQKLKGLLTNKKFCDITVQVKDREFKAHRIILAARSPVFAKFFKEETSKTQNGIINIDDCDPDSFHEFLEYLYSGELENISFRSALHLYKTADRYDVQELKSFCVEHMDYHLNMEYFFDVLSLAEAHNDADLFAAAQLFFNKNMNKICSTDAWKNLMKSDTELASKILVDMSLDVQIVSKRRRLR